MSNSRNTIQRQLVLNAVLSLHTHPTADEVYGHVAALHPAISKATVYRNLAQLAACGKIRRVSHLNAADRFDFNLEPHHHFTCEACGRVFDADVPYRSRQLLAEAQHGTGFVYSGCHITFTGLCPHCKQSHCV